MRSEVIERLMCDLSVDAAEIATRHGFDPAIFDDVSEKLEPAILAGIAEVKATRVSVPAKHRLFLRTVAAAFDAHFVAAPNRHAKAV
jgi:oxygen-independent coproporphyrinogen-3 oxidase